jgi:ElaB/YqjD/DUF883 family membrane-anchored ribosome-binding protein
VSNVATDKVVRLRDGRGGEIAEQVARTVSSMADQLSQRVADLNSKARVVARSTDGFVRASPWQAVGLVTLAGLAAGLLISWAASGRHRSGDEDHYDELSGG